jgi:hypothetical protein
MAERASVFKGSAMAPATKSLTSATEPATQLAELHRDRAGLTSELAGLNASAARLRETAASEAGVLAEIGAMGSAEIVAMTTWASAGCIGDPPAPDQKQRRALAEKLATAQSAAAAAKGAGQDIDHQIGELNNRLRAIGSQIEIAVLDAAELEFAEVCRQNAAYVELLRQSSLSVFGLCSFLSTEGRRLMDRADTEGGKRHLARAEAIAATANKLPKPGVSQVEIAAAANEWARRIAALRKGPAS